MDITSEKSRTTRLSVVAGMIGFAIPVSQFISVPIYEAGGYLAIWMTSLGIYALSTFYLIFFVTDSRGKWAPKLSPAAVEKSTESQDEFDFVSVIKNLWQCFTATFRRRDGYKRAMISFLMVCLSLHLFSTG